MFTEPRRLDQERSSEIGRLMTRWRRGTTRVAPHAAVDLGGNRKETPRVRWSVRLAAAAAGCVLRGEAGGSIFGGVVDKGSTSMAGSQYWSRAGCVVRASEENGNVSAWRASARQDRRPRNRSVNVGNVWVKGSDKLLSHSIVWSGGWYSVHRILSLAGPAMVGSRHDCVLAAERQPRITARR